MNTIILTLLLLITSGMVSANQYLSYVAVDPCRIVDTREGRGVISAGDFRNFRATGSTGELAVQGGTECPNPMLGIKPQAVSAYVLVLPHGVTGGVATAYPSDKLPPPVGAGSTVNFGLGRVTGNTTNITLCEEGFCPADGEFAVLARSTGFNLVVDVQGYFYPMIEQTSYSPPCSDPSTRYTDNGDGTICDNQTGLMWEKKLAADGSDGGDCDSEYPSNWHVGCVNKIFDYSTRDNLMEWLYMPNGTVYTRFLSVLNNLTQINSGSFNIDYDGCLANYCDWRIPRLSELKGLMIRPCTPPGPCIDPIFEPIAVDLTKCYWTSTVLYVVCFGNGQIRGQNPDDPEDSWVRAVRRAR